MAVNTGVEYQNLQMTQNFNKFIHKIDISLKYKIKEMLYISLKSYIFLIIDTK